MQIKIRPFVTYQSLALWITQVSEDLRTATGGALLLCLDLPVPVFITSLRGFKPDDRKIGRVLYYLRTQGGPRYRREKARKLKDS